MEYFEKINVLSLVMSAPFWTRMVTVIIVTQAVYRLINKLLTLVARISWPSTRTS